MLKCFNAAMLSAILVTAAAAAAYAADPAPPQTPLPPQVATGIPGSSAQTLPNSNGHWYGNTWIPSNPSASAARTEQGNYYAKKGFGPPEH